MYFKDLKTNEETPHHYFIGVVMHPITDGDLAGKIYLKYGPVYFHNNDVENLRDALMLSTDKVFKTTTNEALSLYGVSNIAGSIRSMILASNANLGSIHHFSSADKLDDEFFVNFVDLANISKHNRRLLDESRIRGI